MQHPPYPSIDYIIDIGWNICFAGAGVMALMSNLYFRRAIFAFIIMIFLSRVFFKGACAEIEFLLVLFLFVLAIRNLFGGRRDWSQAQPEERVAYRKKITRAWIITLSTIAFASVLTWAGIQFYWFQRRTGSPRVQVTNIPFTYNTVLKPGEACVFVLPNKKTVAAWCETNIFISFISSEGAMLWFGEKPFKQIEYEEVKVPGGGTTRGEPFSYIRHTSTISRGNNETEYVLNVDEYTIGLIKKASDDKRIPLTFNVRKALEKEQVKDKDKVDFFIKQLNSIDPEIQIDSMDELLSLLMCEFDFALLRKDEILKVIQPLTLSANEAVKEKAVKVDKQIKQGYY